MEAVEQILHEIGNAGEVARYEAAAFEGTRDLLQRAAAQLDRLQRIPGTLAETLAMKLPGLDSNQQPSG
jgi:hypothetical protein